MQLYNKLSSDEREKILEASNLDRITLSFYIPIITLIDSGYWDFREFGGIPADQSSNSNQSDVNFVVPGAADSGNTYTCVAEFQKIY